MESFSSNHTKLALFQSLTFSKKKRRPRDIKTSNNTQKTNERQNTHKRKVVIYLSD
jgi:hypothetical protein